MMLATLCVAGLVFATAALILGTGIAMGFDRHMMKEHGRRVRWSDLF